MELYNFKSFSAGMSEVSNKTVRANSEKERERDDIKTDIGALSALHVRGGV